MDTEQKSSGGKNYVLKCDSLDCPSTSSTRSSHKVWLIDMPKDKLASNDKFPIGLDVQKYLHGRRNRMSGMTPIESVISCPRLTSNLDSYMVGCMKESGCIAKGDPCVVQAVKDDSWNSSGIPITHYVQIAKIINLLDFVLPKI